MENRSEKYDLTSEAGNKDKTVFAPFLVPTLNRYEHLKRCMESLRMNTHASNTDVYIALDYPLKESHWEGYSKIKHYIQHLDGFRTCNIIERDRNLGARENLCRARDEIFQKYDRIIVSEDDNYFSPNFLEYINKGLEKYKNDQTIFAICGYTLPIKLPGEYTANYYIYSGFAGWGYGVWRERFQELKFEPGEVYKFLGHPRLVWKYIQGGHSRFTHLLNMLERHEMYGDTFVCMNLIQTERYCIFPTISKVRNYGNDGSGEHCGRVDGFEKQQIDAGVDFNYGGVPSLNKRIEDILFKKQKKSLLRRLYDVYRWAFLWIKGSLY